jgi:hypothetical protein
MHRIAPCFLVALLGGLSALVGSIGPVRERLQAAAPPGRVVYLARGLSDEALLTLSSALAARVPGAILLLDSTATAAANQRFVATWKPITVRPVGHFPEGKGGLERRLQVPVAEPIPWRAGPPLALWRALFPRAERVVVCPASPRAQLLEAACLAGAEEAPLWISHGRPGAPPAGNSTEAAALCDQLRAWGTRRVFLAGATPGADATGLASAGVQVTRLRSEAALASAYQRRLGGHIDTAVICNPADGHLGGMSVLAPWIALQKRAPLLLTGKDGKDAAAVVERAMRQGSLRRVDALVLVAGLQAIPMEKRPNPIPADKDPLIEMEPTTPSGNEPFSYSVGRLFHADPAVVLLMLARERLLAAVTGPRRVLVASNPGGGLPLLETYSRNTARELRNAGYEVTALFGKEITAGRLRKLLPEHDIFLWEGHHNTLVKEWRFPSWDEPLPASFVFLQSCLALESWKVQPLLTRGAVGVVGCSTRTYSGSGGACSLAFFDGLVYEGQSLGGSLRQAKNFLLAYAMLKEKRLGKDATRSGANRRAAWSFTLWGDPTLHLPRPTVPEAALTPVRAGVQGKRIVVELPAEYYGKVVTAKYQVRIPPNARLAGLLRKAGDEDGQPLVPFVFAEVSLPRTRPGQLPKLHSRLPASHWVFLWDQRRRCGYLLATPRAKDGPELRFSVEWPASVAGR